MRRYCPPAQASDRPTAIHVCDGLADNDSKDIAKTFAKDPGDKAKFMRRCVAGATYGIETRPFSTIALLQAYFGEPDTALLRRKRMPPLT